MCESAVAHMAGVQSPAELSHPPAVIRYPYLLFHPQETAVEAGNDGRNAAWSGVKPLKRGCMHGWPAALRNEGYGGGLGGYRSASFSGKKEASLLVTDHRSPSNTRVLCESVRVVLPDGRVSGLPSSI